MNIKKYDELYLGLKDYLRKSFTDFNVYVYQFPQQKKNFPVVMFSEITNQNVTNTLDKIENIDELGYEIEIFCSPENFKETIKQSSAIAEKCDYFMKKQGFKRVSANRVPNIEDRAYKIVLRYSASIMLNNGRIF